MSGLRVKDRIKRVLRHEGVALTPKEVSAFLEDVAYSTVRQEMHRLAMAGELERPGRGYYTLGDLEPRVADIRIERKVRLEGTGFDEDSLRLKLNDMVTRHPDIFRYKKGYYARVPFNRDYFAHLSIFGHTLVCLLVYGRPKTDGERRWEQLLRDHVDLLNGAAR